MLSLTRKAFAHVLPRICPFLFFAEGKLGQLLFVRVVSARSCVAEQEKSQNQKHNELIETDNDFGVGWGKKVLSVLPFPRQSN